MFIGDRGTGIGSRIKGFRRYGGTWKEGIHAEAASVCITNENLTSKTCVFCFSRLNHPRVSQTKNSRKFEKKILGTLYCTNPLCVSVIAKRAIKCRDSLSALAIGLVGLSTVLFDAPFPQFISNIISQNNAEEYLKKTSSFKLQEKIGNHAVVLEVIRMIYTNSLF